MKKNILHRLILYYVNINGFKSKSESIVNIIKTLNPEIIVICELKSVTSGSIRSFFKSHGYEVIFSKSLGMVTASKNKMKMVNVTSTGHNNIISTSMQCGNKYFTLISVYGPQESDKEEART